MQDNFGDRMKIYEMAEAGRRLMPLLPIIARIDGRSFSNFTRGLNRPYDQRLSQLMVSTTKFLVAQTNANCGYTQSDEITLGWYVPVGQDMLFDGRISKMTSTLSAMASVYFNKTMEKYLPSYWWDMLPTFDCRVWNVPNLDEGANAFLWREQDATKNSISMAARHYYSHKELENKNGREMQEMLFQKGVNWNDYPAFFKRGTYIQKRLVIRKFTSEEFERLPPQHSARTNPGLMIQRTGYEELDIPPLGQISNRPGVIFRGETPQLNSTTTLQ